ncbi:nuclear polyadenylated RNA-binding protein NAB2, putative (NAB2) [Plasmodium ovale wallikeri]|uniref:Nuclear polyadenylated RNA-binding protein NAB2, putative (NAB2) n=1 Tax=Plasmodium ovale wallikeri TaxID=864142 RepID=A0A1A8Z2C5_PLAOA|nr:nuclear polyadenylated RNA-binding protein NAB2, putative (NAB2) [Plasmodium ovale wallikeri]
MFPVRLYQRSAFICRIVNMETNVATFTPWKTYVLSICVREYETGWLSPHVHINVDIYQFAYIQKTTSCTKIHALLSPRSVAIGLIAPLDRSASISIPMFPANLVSEKRRNDNIVWLYCANYYCNYSHDHVDISVRNIPECLAIFPMCNLPEIGTNGYYLNKKLINNNDRGANSGNFDDKVAQISISMPKTPPEMKKDKNKNEYNENEYIENLLEVEKQELKGITNEHALNESPIEERKQQKEEEEEEIVIDNVNDITEENYLLLSNGKENENEAVDYNCFDIVINPDNTEEKGSLENVVSKSQDLAENN